MLNIDLLAPLLKYYSIKLMMNGFMKIILNILLKSQNQNSFEFDSKFH